MMKRCLTHTIGNRLLTFSSTNITHATRALTNSIKPCYRSSTTLRSLIGNISNIDSFVTQPIQHQQQQQQQQQLHKLQYRYKSFQATPPLNENESATKEATATNTEAADEDIPSFQNPIHHNDPSHEKIFHEDVENPEDMEQVPLPPLDDGSGKVLAEPHLHELAEEILHLSMYEMKELVDRVADHFGIEENEDDDVGFGAGAGEEGEGDAAPVEEKTAFDLKLTGFDAKAKIKVIKEIRAITGLGLKEAKEMVEGAPKVVKKDIKKEEAEEFKEKLEAIGATVEIE